MGQQLLVVVGIGQFGEHVAKSLTAAGREVLALDKSMERVEGIKDHVARAARVDCTSEAAMKAMGVTEAAAAVVALGEVDFEAAVLGTAVLKSLGVKTVVARSSSPQRGRILTLAGAARVVYPEAEMGEQLAPALIHQSLRATADLPSGYTLAEIRVPEVVSGKTLLELKLPRHHRLAVVAISRGGRWTDPTPESAIQQSDILLVAGRTDKIAALATEWDQS
jgi:trk system potassium uptake protein TrkA